MIYNAKVYRKRLFAKSFRLKIVKILGIVVNSFSWNNTFILKTKKHSLLKKKNFYRL